MNQDDPSPDSLPPATEDSLSPITLLGGQGLDGFDELLPGGVYALVPQSPPARFPLWARLLKDAVATGRVCHVLLRTEPAEFLARLDASGWTGAQAAWMDETLRIYPMVDGFSKLLFRRDVSGLTEELVHWGVQSSDFMLVDAGDELLSLHDLFLATSQIIKFKAWVKTMRLPVLLNFSLAGAGSGMTSLTSLMDHFSGLARMHSDENGSLLTLEYWQSSLGTVAERTVYLNGEPESKRQPMAARPAFYSPSMELAPPQSPSMPMATPAAAPLAAAAPTVVSRPVAVTTGHFTNDHMWARELQMLTGDVWQAKVSAQDIFEAAEGLSTCEIVLRYARNSVLEALARDIDFLRSHLPFARIVVAEHRAALRYPNELMLMKLGADVVIHQDMAVGRWPGILHSLQTQPLRRFEKLSIETVFANAASSDEMGFLELPRFLAEVQDVMKKAQTMGVPFAMAVLSAHGGVVSSEFIQAARIRRQGDFLTTDGLRLFVFFYGCSLTLGPQILDSVFEGRVNEFAADVDWVASELDIHYLIQHLEKHGGIFQPEDIGQNSEASVAEVDTPQEEASAPVAGVVSDWQDAEIETVSETKTETEDVTEAGSDLPVEDVGVAASDEFAAGDVPDEAHAGGDADTQPCESEAENEDDNTAAGSEMTEEPEQVTSSTDAGTSVELAAAEFGLTPKGGLMVPKKLAIRVTEVVPHVRPETPLVLVPDRRKRKDDGNSFVAERRVAELIRRLAHPADSNSRTPPVEPTDPA